MGDRKSATAENSTPLQASERLVGFAAALGNLQRLSVALASLFGAQRHTDMWYPDTPKAQGRFTILLALEKTFGFILIFTIL
jgi:hypothetical protein